MIKPLLKMEKISKAFSGVLACCEVDFELKKGEVHALIGENGAGKSTLMKILTGVYQKDHGKIFLNGESVNINNPIHGQKQGISIIYQEFNLFPHLTVAENIYIKREPKKAFGLVIDDKQMNEDARKMFKKLNLKIKPERKVYGLSVAEQQMLEIVKAISFKSKILIMDEPTAALTEHEIEDLFTVVRELKAQGVGIIYISHRLEELKSIADRVTVMRDGRYIDTLNYSETTISELVNMMVGRSMNTFFPKRDSKIKSKAIRVESLNTKAKLKNISFDVRSGEVLGIAGLMGAGRTEIARAVFGADKIDSGKIFINEQEVKITSPKDAIDYGIGYMTEDRKKDGLALNLSVEDNIILSNIPNYTNDLGVVVNKKVNSDCLKLVKKLKIRTPSLEQIVRNLSGGNQQKVVISKWLCRHSDVLFFDEPTRGIDVGAKHEVYDLINGLAQNGKAIIIISSELPELVGMCDRIIVIRSGVIAGELSKEEATENKIMYLATGGI